MWRSATRGCVRYAPVALLILLLGAVPVVHADSSSKLSLTILGTLLDSGTQVYTLRGADLVFASILGQAVDAPAAKLTYTIDAKVVGLGVSGNSNFHLTGTLANGSRVDVDGKVTIGDAIPAEPFPLGCPAPSPCTSEIPAFFLGTATVEISVGRSSGQHGPDDGGRGRRSLELTLPVQLESPFLNPFGKPLILVSTDASGTPDGNIFIVTTYRSATIDWKGVQTGGSISGTLAAKVSTPVSGSFAMVTTAHEDLFKGTEDETGRITFLDVTPTAVDAAGNYQGHSTIPRDNTLDCSLVTGFPGTCTLTGFQSAGRFTMEGTSASIKGSYSTQWLVPAVALSGTATATLGQQEE